MKLLFVYNPFAGFGHAEKILPEFKSYLNEKGIEFELIKTKKRGDGVNIVREADFQQYDGIIACGGDGTLFEVVNGYFQNNSGNKIPIGIIPIGTGNAFAREMELDNKHWKDAIDILSLNKTRKVDVGYYKANDKEYYFLNILGFGFVADVGKTAQKVKFLGNIAYTLGVFHRLLFLKPYNLKMKMNGEWVEKENIFVEISNTTYTSNFLMAPEAKIDDGLLDITLLNKTNRRTLIKSFPKIFTGEHIHLDVVDTFKTDHIKFETDMEKILTPDGELFGSTPIEVKCIPSAIDFFWK